MASPGQDELAGAINDAAARVAAGAPRASFGEYSLDCGCALDPAELERSGRVRRLGGAVDTASDHSQIDCCPACVEKVRAKWFWFVDRRPFSVEEKPRVWPCQFCHVRRGEPPRFVYDEAFSRHRPAGGAMLGGGCAWYACHSPEADRDVDCCSECWEALTAEQLFPARAFRPGREYMCSSRRVQMLVPGPLRGQDVTDPRPALAGLEHFRLKLDEIHDSFDETAGELIEICGIDPLTANLCAWVPITDEYEEAGGADLWLLADVTDAALPVACAVRDNHGRVSVVRVFDSLDGCVRKYREVENYGTFVAYILSTGVGTYFG